MTQTSIDVWMRKQDVVTKSVARETALYDDKASKDIGGITSARVEQSSTQLHPNIIISKPEKEDISKFKRLNSILLPIPYPDSFYKEIVNDERAQSLTLLAFWCESAATKDSTSSKGQLIGAIRCRVLDDEKVGTGTDPLLYISTLVLLSPYRGLGIATYMLRLLIRHAVNSYGVKTIGAHVWEANTIGLEWYEKRGFKEVAYEEGYYKKLNPNGAKVVSRDISVLDLCNV